MSALPDSILEGREKIGPWNYSARIPEGASSRSYSFAPLVSAVLFNGLGIFLANDVARNVPFWSNAVVWFGVLHALFCLCVWAWMFWGRWVWTAPQMGVAASMAFTGFLFAFHGSIFWSFALYSNAPIGVKLLVCAAVLGWHGWWSYKTVQSCSKIWNTAELRDQVYVRYDCATVYRRSSAKAAMDKVGLKWHPGSFGLIVPFFACTPMYFYRRELVGYFDIPFVPLMVFIIGLSVFVLLTTALATSIMMMFVYPARILAETGNPVLVDMMTPANAPAWPPVQKSE